MTSVNLGRPLSHEDQEYLDGLVAEHQGRPGMLLTVLEKIQERQAQKFLPIEYLEHLAQRTGIAPSNIFSVATFYSLFNLKPQGWHTVSICRGTACHVRGSQRLLDVAQLHLGLVETDPESGSADKVSATTADGQFTVRTVACFGQCALAPVAEVDHQILSHVNERAMTREIDSRRGDRQIDSRRGDKQIDSRRGDKH